MRLWGWPAVLRIVAIEDCVTALSESTKFDLNAVRSSNYNTLNDNNIHVRRMRIGTCSIFARAAMNELIGITIEYNDMLIVG